MADAASTPARNLCRRDAARASVSARDCLSRAKSASPRPIATSRDAWDRATPSATSHPRQSSRPRRLPATSPSDVQASRQPNLKRNFVELGRPKSAAEKVEILAGFPANVRGRLVFLPQDNLNTDGIYGKDYTYREDMTREMMAKVVMENYDPQFAATHQAGDVVVGGFNFGTGSSREQAVTALQAKGIPLVIAGSFSQTYLRNAFNNGFLCVECPEFVTHLRAVFATELRQSKRRFIPGDEVADRLHHRHHSPIAENSSSSRRWAACRNRW